MKLIALMFAPFAFTTGAFVFSGVLEPMAAALGVSVATVATLQSAFAIACAICGPVLARATGQVPPRALLLVVLALLGVLNAASAAAPGFEILFTLRVLVGGIGSLAFPLATVLAVTGVAEDARPKSVSAVYAGIPLALIVGIPMGSVTGHAFGWPASFISTAGICAFALLLVWRFVPPAAMVERRMPSGRLGSPVFAHLGVTFFAASGLFAMVGLIGPVISATTGFEGPGIAGVQFLAGLSSLVGVHLGAWLLAQRIRFALTVPFALLSLSLVLAALPLSIGIVSAFSIACMVASVWFGPAAQSATGALVQSRLAELAGPGATLAFALNGSMIYLGQGLGIAIGALVLSRTGLASTPIAGLVLTLPGIALALLIGARFSKISTIKET